MFKREEKSFFEKIFWTHEIITSPINPTIDKEIIQKK